MKQRYLVMTILILLTLPVALLIFFRTKSDLPTYPSWVYELPLDNPVLQTIVRYVDRVKQVKMTREERIKFKDKEKAFLLKRMFDNPQEYKLFPLAQTRGELLQIVPEGASHALRVPQTETDIVPQADFVIDRATTKSFFKLKNTNQGPSARLVCIPLLRLNDFGRITEERRWRRPRDLDYPGNFLFYFPYTIKTDKKFPYVTGKDNKVYYKPELNYRCYVSYVGDENTEINRALEEYMTSKKEELLTTVAY